jgi:hypothetical protein
MEREWPQFQVWTVHHAVGGTTWHAWRWEDQDAVPARVIHAKSDTELAEYLEEGWRARRGRSTGSTAPTGRATSLAGAYPEHPMRCSSPSPALALDLLSRLQRHPDVGCRLSF